MRYFKDYFFTRTKAFFYRCYTGEERKVMAMFLLTFFAADVMARFSIRLNEVFQPYVLTANKPIFYLIDIFNLALAIVIVGAVKAGYDMILLIIKKFKAVFSDKQ